MYKNKIEKKKKESSLGDSLHSRCLVAGMLPASSKPPSHKAPHPSQPWGTWEWACQVRRKMKEPSDEATSHLCVGLLGGPPSSPLPPCPPTTPWSLQLAEATILQPIFLSLNCFKSFLPSEYLVCVLFGPRHIHLHFSMMIRIFVPAFPIFLIPLGYSSACAWCLSYFSIQNHLWISFSCPCYSLRLLVKTGLTEMGGKATSPM